MSRTLIFGLTLLAMLAFAGNSLLCRLALKETGIDPASFTAVRIVSGALALALILRLRGGLPHAAGTWRSALALFAYAAGFSYAYVSLPAGARPADWSWPWPVWSACCCRACRHRRCWARC